MLDKNMQKYTENIYTTEEDWDLWKMEIPVSGGVEQGHSTSGLSEKPLIDSDYR